MTIDTRPFTATQRAVNETARRRVILPACTALLDKRRLRHAMQNDPIIADGETGILSSRDEGATLIRILLARNEGDTRAGRVMQGNAAKRYRKFGYAVWSSNPSDVG